MGALDYIYELWDIEDILLSLFLSAASVMAELDTGGAGGSGRIVP